MPKLNVQQNNANVIKALRNALAIGQIKGPIASDGNDNFTSTGSNRNLLDNAYFVGGGSQLGDGIFPINQRGQTVYTTAAWNMDRWYGACTLYSDYLHIPSFIEQSAEYPLNTPLTMSAMLADGTIVSGTATFTDRNTQQYFYIDGTNIQLVRAADGMVMIWTRVGVNVKAVKLEKGTVSTLANDAPPDFGEELRKCQRYFMRITAKNGTRGYAGIGSANNSKNMLCLVPMPVVMRATPNVSFSNCNCYNFASGGTIPISAINLDSWSENGVFVFCTPSDSSQVVQYQPYALRIASGGYVQFSAEL